MFQDSYIKLKSDDVVKTTEILNPLLQGSQFQPQSTVIMMRPLPFYKDTVFYDLADHQTLPALRRFAIWHKKLKQAHIIDYKAESLYKLNTEFSLTLNDETVEDYFKFFMGFVRGPHSQFLIIETVDDIPFREDPPPQARKGLARLISPLKIEKTGKKSDTYLIGCCFLSKDMLCQGQFLITEKGHIESQNHEILVEDIPVLDDTLGQ
jgi:hypothetical protein